MPTREPIEHAHNDSGMHCLVLHPGRGQCFQCSICGKWIPAPQPTAPEVEASKMLDLGPDAYPAEYKEVPKPSESTDDTQDPIEVALIMEIVELKAYSNLSYNRFHGQDDGEDPELDEWCRKEFETQKRLIAKVKALISEQTTKARIDELASFNPFFTGDHSKCPDPRTCIGYGNAVSDYDIEREIRLAKLNSRDTPSGDNEFKEKVE